MSEIALTTWPRIRFRPNRVHLVRRPAWRGRTECGIFMPVKAWVWKASPDEWPDACRKCRAAASKDKDAHHER